MKQPNIVFIMCDQMRFDAIGCNGNPIVQTPNLDRLAASGVNFRNSFTPDPICVPARASLTTGFYPHKCTGHKKNSGSIKEGFPLLGEEMNKRGYETYAIGKLHYNPYRAPGEPRTTHGLKTTELMESGRILSKFDPQNRLVGLEDYHDYLHTVGWGGYTRGHGLGNNDVYAAPSPIPQEHYVDTWVADRAIAYMQQHIQDQPEAPFFMWASFPKPHSAFDPPQPFAQMYDPRDMPDPLGDLELLKARELNEQVERHYDYMWDLLSPQAKKVIKAYYYGLISHQDQQIGKMLDFLEKNGLRDDTIIVYTADHGEMLGDFGLFFKSNLYNSSVRVPLMISYPRKIAKGKVSHALAGLQDLLPTMLSLADAPLEQEVDGRDLTPAIIGYQPVRDYYIAQCGDDPVQQYMVAGLEWKYIYHQQGGVEELYSQLEDPAELYNRASSNDPEIQQVKAAMRQYLIHWCTENNDKGMLENGDLKKQERTSQQEKPKRGNTFGRRWY
jgi:arylsulfatase